MTQSTKPSSDVPKAFPLAFGLTVGSLSLLAIFICLGFLFLRRRRPRPVARSYSSDSDNDSDDHVAIDLSRFPKLLYRSKMEETNSTSAEEASVGSSSSCAICLADYSDGELLRLLPECGHSFHVACVDPWLMKRKSVTCPICRHHSPSLAALGSDEPAKRDAPSLPA
ncbi:Probable E3 ubiquitin-protein ligase ATL44 [Linum grandiflorum]